MLPRKEMLQMISKSISEVLEKIDKENEQFINSLSLSEEERKIVLKSMEEIEKKLQVFFIAQKKEYLKRIRELPGYLKKNKKKVKVKKADGVSDEIINGFIETITDFIFSDNKAQVEKLVELYQGFSDSMFAKIAEISARAVEGSKLGSEMSLTSQAVNWLNQHKIKFAQQVNQTTNDEVIKCLKNGLVGSQGIVATSNDLIVALPNYFKQPTINQKRTSLTSIKDVDIYNRLYQELEKQECFEFYRARRIARTETISSMNAATLEGWRQSQTVKGKEWICAGGERSRRWHKSANGQKILIDEPFLVDGEQLMHPGDSSLGASARNVIQCRCSMKSVLAYQMELTDSEKKAVNDYMGFDSYITNEKLRTGAELQKKEQELVNQLDKVLDKSLNYTGSLTRSLEFYDQASLNDFLSGHKTGEVVEYKGYTSATKGGTYNPNGQVQIHIINSSKGNDISSFNTAEQEILYKRGSRFIVDNIYQEKGVYNIKFSEYENKG